MCVTVECVEASARILTALDPTADPCDDMAKFACGGWIERQARTAGGKDVVLVLENLQSSVDHQLKRKYSNWHFPIGKKKTVNNTPFLYIAQ
jgi:hypothetical protein